MILYPIIDNMIKSVKICTDSIIKLIKHKYEKRNQIYSLAWIEKVNKNSAKEYRIYTLRLILKTSIILLSIMSSTLILNIASGKSDGIINPVIILMSLLTMCVLFFISKSKYFLISSYIIFGIFLSITTITGYTWGLSLPFTILGFALSLSTSLALFDMKRNKINLVLIATSIVYVGYREIYQTVDLEWKKDPTSIQDVIVYMVILFFISTLIYMYKKQTSILLEKSIKLNNELTYERDNLEKILSIRTSQLRIAEYEKFKNSENILLIGKIASGLFHDISSPINAISITVDQMKNIKNDTKNNNQLIEMMDDTHNTCIKLCTLMKTIGSFTYSNKKIGINNVKILIDESLKLIAHKIRNKKIEVQVLLPDTLFFIGHDIVFTHIIVNLISNAIDSYEDNFNNLGGQAHKVIVKAESNNDEYIEVSVKDFGKGIPEENIQKIYTPFFTTKNINDGHGFGLTSSNDMCKKYFDSDIKVKSKPGEGSVFYFKIKKSNAQDIKIS